MNCIAIKLKPKNFSLNILHGLTLNPRHNIYICFIGRKLDSQATMLTDQLRHSEYNEIHES